MKASLSIAVVMAIASTGMGECAAQVGGSSGPAPARADRLDLSTISSGVISEGQSDNNVACNDTQNVGGRYPIRNCLRVSQSFGSKTASGVRQAIEGYSTLRSPTSPSNKTRYYVGGSFTSESVSGDGGFATTTSSAAPAGAAALKVRNAQGLAGATLTVGLAQDHGGSRYQQVVVNRVSGDTLFISPVLAGAVPAGATVAVTRGELQGAISQSVNRAGSTYMDAVIGYESNITVEKGGAPRIKIWNSNVNNPDDAAPGFMWDAAIGLSSASSLHARTGILFAPYAGYFPVEASGTLIAAASGPSQPMQSVARGIDLSNVRVTDVVLAAQANSVSGIAKSTAEPGFALQANLSGGAAEIDLVNTYENAPTALAVFQKTGPASYTDVLHVTGGGSLRVPGVIHAAGGVRLPIARFADLPACTAEARATIYFLVDAPASLQWRGLATGGGDTGTNVTCDGKAWRYM